MLLKSFILIKCKSQVKFLQQLSFKTRPKVEEHMLFVTDESIHQEHLSHPLKTKIKQFEIAVTFLSGYNGIFIVTNKSKRFFFTKSINDDDFAQLNNPTGAYEIKSPNNEINGLIIEDGYFTEATYPFTIEPNFSTLESMLEILSKFNGSKIAFAPDDSLGDFL